MYPQYAKCALRSQGSPAKTRLSVLRLRSGLMLFYPGRAPDTCQVFYVVRRSALPSTSGRRARHQAAASRPASAAPGSSTKESCCPQRSTHHRLPGEGGVPHCAPRAPRPNDMHSSCSWCVPEPLVWDRQWSGDTSLVGLNSFAAAAVRIGFGPRHRGGEQQQPR